MKKSGKVKDNIFQLCNERFLYIKYAVLAVWFVSGRVPDELTAPGRNNSCDQYLAPSSVSPKPPVIPDENFIFCAIIIDVCSEDRLTLFI
jgi:hypothetical protein